MAEKKQAGKAGKNRKADTNVCKNIVLTPFSTWCMAYFLAGKSKYFSLPMPLIAHHQLFCYIFFYKDKFSLFNLLNYSRLSQGCPNCRPPLKYKKTFGGISPNVKC